MDSRKTVKPALQPASQNVAQWQSILQENEKIVRVASIHPGIYWKGVVVFLFSLFLILTVFNLGVFIMFVSLVMLSFAYLTQYYLLLALTDKRVIVRRGILQLETVQMHLNKIESVEVETTIMGRILGYSTVLITGMGSRVTAVPYIGDATPFRNELDRMILEREGTKA